MFSNKLDFSSSAIWIGYYKSSHIQLQLLQSYRKQSLWQTYNFYSQLSQAVHAKMEAHAGILQGVDELILLANVHLDILAVGVKLVSKSTYNKLQSVKKICATNDYTYAYIVVTCYHEYFTIILYVASYWLVFWAPQLSVQWNFIIPEKGWAYFVFFHLFESHVFFFPEFFPPIILNSLLKVYLTMTLCTYIIHTYLNCIYTSCTARLIKSQLYSSILLVLPYFNTTQYTEYSITVYGLLISVVT